MSAWISAGEQSRFEGGKITPVTLRHAEQAHELVVIRDANDALHVFTDRCPHRGAPFSDLGLLDGDRLVCGWHYWGFRLEDGVNPHAPESCAEKWPCRIEEGALLIDLDG